jgi:uncharacterized protein YebE (UPF0316 family)
MTPELTALFALPWGPFFIFGLRIVDVSFDTARVLAVVRGNRVAAAGLGFFQALIWILAVGSALKFLDSWYHIMGYAVGYASGNVVGMTIENALAYGLSQVRIVSQHGGVEIAEALRERGFGATEIPGYGRDGGVEIVHSVVQRQHLSEVVRIVDQWDSKAFVTVEEPRVLRGGLLARRNRVNIPWVAERMGRQRA